jgi:hypothetical protein
MNGDEADVAKLFRCHSSVGKTTLSELRNTVSAGLGPVRVAH